MITRTSRLNEKTSFLRAAELIFTLCGSSFNTSGQSLTPQDLLFFDIETTGLSPDSSFLYLIGCLYLDGDEVVHTQFFSEGIADEAELIEAYDDILVSHRVLAHFNGQTFDIPYINRKRARLGLSDPCEIIPADSGAYTADAIYDEHTVFSFDIFKVLRGYKKFLGLASMSQKSLESYCGLDREDIYDGGQLIEVYGRYIATKKLEDLRSKSSTLQFPEGCDSASLLKTLLLHNYEDVLGMLEVCRMLNLPAFLRKYSEQPVIADYSREESGFSITLGTDLDLFMLDRQTVTCPDGSVIHIAYHRDSSRGCGAVVLTVPVRETELKLFYSNYRDYFYLPAEDTAIPRSIGEFMDKSLRVKCTPANCYTRHQLTCVPLSSKPSKNDCYSFKLFRPDFKSASQYADLTRLEEDADLLSEYVRGIIRGI